MSVSDSPRRSFIKRAPIATMGFSTRPSSSIFSQEREEKVRLGLIGVGMRGQDNLAFALQWHDADVIGTCDVQQRNDSPGKGNWFTAPRAQACR